MSPSEGEHWGHRLAAYIIVNELTERPIAAYEDGETMAVLAHLPRDTFQCAGRGREGSHHMTWDIEYGESHRFDTNQASGRTNRAFRDDPDVLMLLNAGFRNPKPSAPACSTPANGI